MNSLRFARVRLPLICLILAACVDCALVLDPSLPHRPAVLILAQFLVLFPSVIWVWKSSASAVASGDAVDSPASGFRQSRIFILVVVLAVIACGAWLSFNIYPGALNPDEIAYRFEGRLIAAGHFFTDPLPDVSSSTATPPEVRFNHCLATPAGLSAMYPLLWPAVLALTGSTARFGWAVNPILALLLLYLVWKVAVRMFNAEVAVLSLFLLVVCPFFLSMIVGTLSHVLAGCLITGSILSFQIWLDSRKVGFLSLGVGLVGLCLFVRPFTALAASAGLGLVILWQSRRFAHLVKPALAVFSLIALVVILFFLQNRLQTGHYLVSAYGMANRAAAPTEITLDWRKIAAYAPQEIGRAWPSTLAYSGPFLLLAAIYSFLTGSIPRAAIALLSCTFIAEVLLYFLDVLPTGAWFGLRMYFEGLPGVAILGAAVAVDLARKWRVPAKAVVATVLAVTAVQVAQCATTLFALRRSAQPSQLFIRFLYDLPIQNAVVFMRSEDLPENAWEEPWNFNINNADWRHGENIFLIDPGPAERARITRKFDRPRMVLATYNGTSDRASWQELPLPSESTEDSRR